MSWKHFQHGADIGIRGVGATPELAFQQAALALTAVITDPETVSPLMPVTVQCDAPDLELLFVDWLNALIYEMATRRMLFREFKVLIEGTHLNAVAVGEQVEVWRHKPVVEVKGATYTELSVHQQADGAWFAQCVVDV